MPSRLGPLEMLIIFALVLLTFGPGKLPQVRESVGKALQGFYRSPRGRHEEPPGQI
ncbi:MAG: twin-arginine translocase TatA/TatE family subunit [Chloroflexi bacterium]|nr:twin-arginine translocase TatA/TatE family subunit [Chloroflexota bacterium]